MEPPLAYAPKFLGAWWITCHGTMVATIKREGESVLVSVNMHRKPVRYLLEDWTTAEARLLQWADANRARLIRETKPPPQVKSRLEGPFELE